ncbi:LOW QUALITY PROTEIN: COPII coat assembly protein sec16-like [Portunus trituberculatus]|uniref:LOW QUALITY PROTEIN: COPII coat assembly protein sec16-like n=1 Tax=Portunus trituberculatus TaxID=210409 RepID=UPI001E1CBE0B|nr:LOW QUALITY PROTEIN: COPII coat assembly protein sec16-like [Portunus trituberculatus]
MDGVRIALQVAAVAGWLLVVSCSSLFEDVAMTLGGQRPSPNTGVNRGESLFGGVKMSLSTKELQEAGLWDAAGPDFGGLPASGTYNLPQPKAKKVASATVSTGLGSPKRGSLFDELPNAGASFPDAGVSASRYFTTAAPRTTASLFQVSGLVLPLSQEEVRQQGSASLQAFSLPDPIQTQRAAAPPQESVQPTSEMQDAQQDSTKEEKMGQDMKSKNKDDEEEDVLSALQLLERYAPQLAAVINATAMKKDSSTTFPHAVQGDFQLALETLSGSPHMEAHDDSASYEDPLDLYSFLDDTNEEVSLSSTRERLSKKDNIAATRRRRLEDLRLALDIIRSLESPPVKDEDEEFQLKLAKSIFDQHINSLSELTRRQRDTLHSLMTMVRGSSRSRNPNSFRLPPVKDARPPASPPAPRRNSYLPPRQDDPPPPAPRRRYGPPQRDDPPPPRNPEPPAPPRRSYGAPTQRDPLPPSPPDGGDSEEATGIGHLSLTFTPADIYTVLSGIHGARKDVFPSGGSYRAPVTHGPTPPPKYYIAVPSSIRTQADDPQLPLADDVRPPAPPVSTTTRRPSESYLPPRDEGRRPYDSFESFLADPLPLETPESLEDDVDSWRPILRPADPGMYSQRPSDEQRDDARNTTITTHNYHYHYHYSQFSESDSSSGEEQQDDVMDMEGYGQRQDDPLQDMGYGRQRDAPAPPSTTQRRHRGQSDPNVSSYSSIFSADPNDDSFETFSQPPAPPSSGYATPPASPPEPPRRGYGSPPAAPPMRNYGPPPAPPPPPRAPPAPPRSCTHEGLRDSTCQPTHDVPPSTCATLLLQRSTTPTRFPRSPTPVTNTPANPTSPAPPPPPVYGAPPADPTPPAPPPVYRAPPADPAPPAPPPVYGAPPANPTTPPSTYGAPPADPAPPAPPPTTSRPVVLAPPRPPPLLKSHFSVFNKKSKPPRLFQRAPVVAVGPVRVRQADTPSLLASDTRGTTRNPLQLQQEQLQMQYLRNEQRLRDEQRTLQDINGLRFQIQAQEQQRDEMMKNMFKDIKKEKESGFKKLFYKGASLLGAMSFMPFSTRRRKRAAPNLSCTTDALNLAVPPAPNCTNQANFSLTDVVGVLQAKQKGIMQEISLSDLESLLPPPAALHDPGCLHRSFCRLMVGLEGTPLYTAFLNKYLQLFRGQDGGGGGGVAGQALHFAQQRLTYSTIHSKGTCRAFHCPYPDKDL